MFVRVYTSAAAIKDSPSKLAYVWQSQGCDSFYFQRVGRKARQPSPPSPSGSARGNRTTGRTTGPEVSFNFTVFLRAPCQSAHLPQWRLFPSAFHACIGPRAVSKGRSRETRACPTTHRCSTFTFRDGTSRYAALVCECI